MRAERLRVGIIGLTPYQSWAAMAHVPALRALSDDFEIVGVANTSRASGETAAAATGIPRAFESVDELVNSPDVDIVTVTVKVPHHFEIVKAAIKAGKHIYCEWPLGRDLTEAQEMTRLARERGVLGVVGTQVRAAPEIKYLGRLIASGYVGEVLSTSIIGSGGVWGGTITERAAYTLDRANGATMLTIPFGHTMAAVRDVLGDVIDLSARLLNRRTSAVVMETGETVAMNAHDQVLVEGVLESGAPISIHFRGGLPRGTGLLWEINGTDGDIQITGPSGHIQMVPLAIKGANGDDQGIHPIDVSKEYYSGLPIDVRPRNVARVYARMAADLRSGTHTAPTFADAVGLHRLIAAVETSDRSEGRVHRYTTDAANEFYIPQDVIETQHMH